MKGRGTGFGVYGGWLGDEGEAMWNCKWGETYFLPKHPLAPRENGCEASNVSFPAWPSQRSGLNSHGEEKLAWEMLAAMGLVETIVYEN
jgi:hypothetical protein